VANINRCIFSGNATRDPALKVSSTGKTYVTFGLACSNRIFDHGSRDYVDTVVYVDFVAFGEVADYVRKNVHRGTKVYVESVLEQSMYRDKQSGKIRRWTSYRAINVDAYEDRQGRSWTSPEWI
jgi:single stranded DNA-binding protein